MGTAHFYAIYDGGDTASKLGMAEAMNKLPGVVARVINGEHTTILQVMYPAARREDIRKIAPVEETHIEMVEDERWS